LWTHAKLAKELGVLPSSVTNVLTGQRPFSVLIPRIARKLKVPKEALRSYLVDLADRKRAA
jgi:transcriptional regulator with XRE-family HTH domain